MSNPALTHLRQARGFLRAGNAEKAVDLLEKARLLAGDDRQLQRQVLEELAVACEATGRLAQAQRCRSSADRLAPAESNSLHRSTAGAAPVQLIQSPRRRTSSKWLVAGLAMAAVLLIAGIGFGVRALRKPGSKPSDSQLANGAPTAASATQPVAGAATDPLSAFAVQAGGIMLTNRHVVDAPNQEPIPNTLASAGLPGLTFRGASYYVCFGPKERFLAKVMHQSVQFDFGVVKIDKKFKAPLAIASKSLRQGEDVWVCGYPGVVQDTLNEASATPQRILDISRKWQQTRFIDPFDEFSPDVYNSTLTKGIVSSPERNIRAVSFMQIDAAISPGNSGGPVMNQRNEVVGIATFGINPEVASVNNYNFALLMDQLHDELNPYLTH